MTKPLTLHHARNGRTEEICNGCGRKIQPHALMIARTDGWLFCTEGCARKDTDVPTRPGIT